MKKMITSQLDEPAPDRRHVKRTAAAAVAAAAEKIRKSETPSMQREITKADRLETCRVGSGRVESIRFGSGRIRSYYFKGMTVRAYISCSCS